MPRDAPPGEPLREHVARLRPCSCSEAAALIRAGGVFLDGRRCLDPNAHVGAEARVVAHEAPPSPAEELVVLDDTRDWWVIDKPAGIQVNETETTARRAVVELLGREARLVHRLDRDTSGLLLVARTARGAQLLSEAFRTRAVAKTYHAVTLRVPERSRCDAPIGPDPRRPRAWRARTDGKPAQTDFEVEAARAPIHVLHARPLTGRTHQIRIHAAHLGAPIFGDLTYGGVAATRVDGQLVRAPRVLLHAAGLSFELEGRRYAYASPWPEDFARVAALATSPWVETTTE